MNCMAIIPAGGVGKRFGKDIPKQYIEIKGIPTLIRTLQLIDIIPEISQAVVSIDPEWQSFVDSKLMFHKIQKKPLFVKSGDERQDSIYNAIFIDEIMDSDIIVIHDAVRPAASPKLFEEIINAASKYGAAIPGVPPSDTIKIFDKDNYVKTTIPRKSLKAIQTPQGFKTEMIIDAYKEAHEKNWKVTDDSALIEILGHQIKIIDGEYSNIKLTNPQDLILLEAHFKKFLQG